MRREKKEEGEYEELDVFSTKSNVCPSVHKKRNLKVELGIFVFQE